MVLGDWCFFHGSKFPRPHKNIGFWDTWYATKPKHQLLHWTLKSPILSASDAVEEIRCSPVEVGSLSHYLQGSIHPRCAEFSSINSRSSFSWHVFFSAVCHFEKSSLSATGPSKRNGLCIVDSCFPSATIFQPEFREFIWFCTCKLFSTAHKWSGHWTKLLITYSAKGP